MNTPFFLFHVAKEYFENGTLYASKYFKTTNFSTQDNSIFQKLCVPATNISFSLELTFKAFLMGSQAPREHDLFKLYGLIDAGIKKRIFENYRSHNTYKDYTTINLLDGDGKDHGKVEIIRNINKDEKYILAMLKKHRSSFVNFRYVFDLKKDQKWSFDFKDFSNFTLSALTILGETLNLKVVTKAKDESPS
jgi:hypothetical protein